MHDACRMRMLIAAHVVAGWRAHAGGAQACAQHVRTAGLEGLCKGQGRAVAERAGVHVSVQAAVQMQ